MRNCDTGINVIVVEFGRFCRYWVRIWYRFVVVMFGTVTGGSEIKKTVF